MNKNLMKILKFVIVVAVFGGFVFYKRYTFLNYFTLSNWLTILEMLGISLILFLSLPITIRKRNKRPYDKISARRISLIVTIIVSFIIIFIHNKINLIAEIFPTAITITTAFFLYFINKRVLTMSSSNDLKKNKVAKKTKLELILDKLIAPKVKSKEKIKNKFLITIMYILIFCFGAGVLFCLYIIITAPSFDAENLYNKEATIIYDADNNEIAKIGMEKREVVTYEELPEVLIDAIVATEDSRFFQHNGFDIARFTKAFIGQLAGNSSAGGGSTLTMQVAKNAYTDYKAVSGIKGIVRKATDIYLAIFKLEKNYTKEEIIEFYVNSPWLGNNSWGIEQASQTYFGKSVKDISLTEAAILAGMFQAPASYNPFNSVELTTQRRAQVLNLMVRHGYITETEAEAAKAISVESLLTDQKSSSEYMAFIDTVVTEVWKRTGYDAGSVPMIIYSTMQKDKQDVVNKLMNGESFTFVNDVVQMGIAVTDVNDGSIAAIGAGRNRVGERQFNYATQINRHPGSTAKPFFAYGPLIEYNDASTYTPFFDEKYSYTNGGSIVNADRKYLGLMTMRYALARSRNIPALQAFQQVDAENVTEFVHNCGINYGKNLYESAATGGFNGMSPLNMSAAYGTFARGGYYIEPYSYTKIILRETEEVIEYKPTKTKAMSKETASMINYMLETAVDLGALGSKISVSGTDVAAKTGTSSIDAAAIKDKKLPASAIMDSWFDIYSPDYSISMWYGYENLTTEYYLTSSAADKVRNKVAKLLATNIFEKNSQFKISSGITLVEVEKETFPAKLASAYTPKDYKTKEYFKKGTEPIEISDRFNTLDNPTNLKGSYNNGNIVISWDKIATPNAISTTYLQTYFNTNYDKWAEKYYQERLTYNTNYIGTIGYQVYIKSNTSDVLTSLGYTNSNSYNYIAPNNNTDYTFVVKSAYSIFKDNMSTGTSLTVNPYDINTEILFQMTEEVTTLSKKDNLSYYTDFINPFKLFVNGIETTNFTYTSKIYKMESGTETEISKIPLNSTGSYKISYIVTYNEKKYNPTRKVIIN